MLDKQITEQNKTYAAIAKAAIKQTDPQPKQTTNITLTSKTHIKLTALIIEAHIATLHNTGQYGKILSKSLKDNFDIDAIFPDRDSRRIFDFYYDLDNDLSDIEDDPYIDDNDYRRSSLNLSTPLQTEEITVDTEKRPRTDDDEFIKTDTNSTKT